MSNFDLDIKAVEKLANLLTETGLSEIEYEEGDKRIRCVKHIEAVQVIAPTAAAPVAAAPVTDAPAAVVSGTPITSPMVGTVYMSPDPDSPAFIKVGDKIKEGDTLCIIEAMKVMNPIKATKSGEIKEILVSDAKPVEFGETLITIA